MNTSQYVAAIFDHSAQVSGDQGWAAAAWNSIRNQHRLFQCMLGIGDLSEGSILDVGCGHADFYAWLKNHFQKDVDYTGIDISKNMVEAAKRINEANVVQEDLNRYRTMHDWVIGVGPFNLDIAMTSNKDWIDPATCHEMQMSYLRNNIRKMYNLSNKGTVFTVLSASLVHDHQEGLFYYSPSEVFDFCLTLTPKIALDQISEPTQLIVYLPKD